MFGQRSVVYLSDTKINQSTCFYCGQTRIKSTFTDLAKIRRAPFVGGNAIYICNNNSHAIYCQVKVFLFLVYCSLFFFILMTLPFHHCKLLFLFPFFSFSWSVSPADIRNRLSRTSITGTPLAESCPEKKQHICQPQKYRHATSFCNNVQNPTWGSADTNYGRLLQASYSDGKFNEFLVFNMSPINYCAPPGINQIRLAVSGKPLPSPVKIADSIHTPKKAANGYLTTLSAVWAQFIQNDISYPITFAGQLKLTTFQCLPNYSMLNCY